MNYFHSLNLAALGLLLSARSLVVSAASIRGYSGFRDSALDLRQDSAEGPQEGNLGAQHGTCGGEETSFEEFVRKHRRSYITGSQEYEARKALFNQRAVEARAHNCRPGKFFWKAGATSLSDWTVEELDKLRGRRGRNTEAGQPSSGGRGALERLAVLETGGVAQGAVIPPLPTSFGWNHLEAMNEIFDQGACGSCWASATTVMLRSHCDIYQKHQNLSVQQLVSCVPNPEQCGGSGGCNGSTGELALDYVYHNGLEVDSIFPYRDTDIACPSSMAARRPDPRPQPNGSSFLAFSPRDRDELQTLEFGASPARHFGMVGWSRLPVNKLQPLYHALYREGPVAVSIVAGYAWNAYISGIMNNCSTKDTVVNHLVVLFGYGADPHVGAKYWHIQNSWGTSWGENGQIRMIRLNDTKEESFCGMDKDPAIGTGCKGGPAQVWVCGSCGILYDNVVAHFHGSTPQAQEMLQRRGQIS